MSGYSGTPLVKKLGFKPDAQIYVHNIPIEYEEWLGDRPSGLMFTDQMGAIVSAAHLFTTSQVELASLLTVLRSALEQEGFIWVSWPKKAARVATDITEDTIREIALPMGFVDIKVCAVSEIWSGLKLVIRKSERR